MIPMRKIATSDVGRKLQIAATGLLLAAELADIGDTVRCDEEIIANHGLLASMQRPTRDIDLEPVWGQHFVEMGRKTVLRRLFKYLPVSIELATAASIDSNTEAGKAGNYEDALKGEYSVMPDDAPASLPDGVDGDTGEWNPPRNRQSGSRNRKGDEMSEPDHAITITEAAQRLSVSSRTIERMIKAKKLPAFRAGAGRGVWRIWPAALDLAFAPEQDQPANAAGKRIPTCLSANGVTSGTSTSSRRMVHELDTLLAQRTKRQPKSTTTS